MAMCHPERSEGSLDFAGSFPEPLASLNLAPQQQNEDAMFDIGSTYTRKEIHARLGGSMRACLLEARGSVVG
jgi:hypothetical protein